MGEKGVCRRIKKKGHKEEFIPDIWGKRGATYGRKGVTSEIPRLSDSRSESGSREAADFLSSVPR